MTTDEYENEVMRTFAQPSPMTLRELLLIPALGLCGEAGEVADIVKKAAFQGHDLDYTHLAEELGDVLWYLTLAVIECGYTLDGVMQLNVNKLRERYPDGFSAERSRNRDNQ